MVCCVCNFTFVPATMSLHRVHCFRNKDCTFEKCIQLPPARDNFRKVTKHDRKNNTSWRTHPKRTFIKDDTVLQAAPTQWIQTISLFMRSPRPVCILSNCPCNRLVHSSLPRRTATHPLANVAPPHAHCRSRPQILACALCV